MENALNVDVLHKEITGMKDQIHKVVLRKNNNNCVFLERNYT